MTNDAKMALLDAWRYYEELARHMCRAYFAMKYNAPQDAIRIIQSAEITILDEKLANKLIDAIRKEQE